MLAFYVQIIFMMLLATHLFTAFSRAEKSLDIIHSRSS